MSKEATALSALKLALEALEKYCTPYKDGTHPADEAITALREALASEAKEQPASGIKQVIELYDSPKKPAQQEPVECKTLCELCVKRSYRFCANSAQTTLIPSPPAQQQEPEYAWPTVADYERDVGFQTNEAFRIAWNMARTTNRMLGHTSSQPAQRTWVNATTWRGLTDEEMIDLQDRCGISIHQSDFQTIEAKLKEKNT